MHVEKSDQKTVTRKKKERETNHVEPVHSRPGNGLWVDIKKIQTKHQNKHQQKDHTVNKTIRKKAGSALTLDRTDMAAYSSAPESTMQGKKKERNEETRREG